MTEIIELTKTSENFIVESMAIEVTPAAINQIKTVMVEDKNIVRIGLKGGGCLGFLFIFEFIEEEKIDAEEDLTAMVEGIRFVMDIFSKDYLKGTTLDFTCSLMETGFKFINNTTSKSCGCGKSVAF